MRWIVSWILILVVAIATRPVQAADDPPSPAEQFKKLKKEYELASSGGAANDEERYKLIGRVFRERYRLSRELVALAEKYPNDPIAIEALVQATWYVNGTPWPVELAGTDNEGWIRALALLERDHIASEKLDSVCQRVAYGFNKEYEQFLRVVLAKSPHHDIQALACLSLAHFLTNRLQRLVLIEGDPKLTKEFSDLFGKEYLDGLRRQDRNQATREAEQLFERAEREFGDVELAEGGTIGGKVRADLYEMRHLIVGKEAPDIKGVDQDGTPFKLSDYRGSVVLLDFWQEY
ncbi:MAG: redoxin domain-containing protein [Planctomycetia bacterium]|nr:redoxin domain-containing protein [Planctomycetia bacterium]